MFLNLNKKFILSFQELSELAFGFFVMRKKSKNPFLCRVNYTLELSKATEELLVTVLKKERCIALFYY